MRTCFWLLIIVVLDINEKTIVVTRDILYSQYHNSNYIIYYNNCQIILSAQHCYFNFTLFSLEELNANNIVINTRIRIRNLWGNQKKHHTSAFAVYPGGKSSKNWTISILKYAHVAFTLHNLNRLCKIVLFVPFCRGVRLSWARPAWANIWPTEWWLYTQIKTFCPVLLYPPPHVYFSTDSNRFLASPHRRCLMSGDSSSWVPISFSLASL